MRIPRPRLEFSPGLQIHMASFYSAMIENSEYMLIPWLVFKLKDNGRNLCLY